MTKKAVLSHIPEELLVEIDKHWKGLYSNRSAFLMEAAKDRIERDNQRGFN